ncbi:MAG: ribonuclease J [Acidimicrobiia bacterium]|nr:ribonuclease J [Acidimicrobiia bacterium]
MSVKVGFLGGLGEIGRNCAIVEIGGRIAMIDCGLMFPEEDMLGVDLVFPDFSDIIARAADVECVILTHGHEDHVGSLAYFLREVNVPVYGTPMAIEFARSRVEELGVEADMHHVDDLEWVKVGPFKFALVRVSHSVPQATGVVLDTPEGMIVHSGDYKLDPTPIDGVPTDLPTFAGFGRQGVRLLLADSTNAEIPGYVPSEASLAKPLRDFVAGAEGRVILACFSSHIHRVQQAINSVAASGRKFAFLGRSMLRNTEVAQDLGLLTIPKGLHVEMKDLVELPSNQTAIICTGSQGEPFAALSLMASGEHRSIHLEPDDTVIISATPIPGNETAVSRVINNLMRRGVRVWHGRNAQVHVSGHAAQEEIKTFINVIRPQAFVPVHGEYRHLRANAELAQQMGVDEVEICLDGDVVVLEDGKMRVERKALSAGYVYLDGSGIGDVEGVLRDRRHLADDGAVIVTLGIDVQTGEIVFGPDVDSHGLSDDPEELHKRAREAVIAGLDTLEKPLDLDTIRRKVRSSAGRAIKKRSSRRPVVFPVVVEM